MSIWKSTGEPLKSFKYWGVSVYRMKWEWRSSSWVNHLRRSVCGRSPRQSGWLARLVKYDIYIRNSFNHSFNKSLLNKKYSYVQESDASSSSKQTPSVRFKAEEDQRLKSVWLAEETDFITATRTADDHTCTMWPFHQVNIFNFPFTDFLHVGRKKIKLHCFKVYWRCTLYALKVKKEQKQKHIQFAYVKVAPCNIMVKNKNLDTLTFCLSGVCEAPELSVWTWDLPKAQKW